MSISSFRLRFAGLILLPLLGCGGAALELPRDEAGLERLLKEVHPRSAAQFRRRACALWRLNRREHAVREAKLGLVLEPRSAAGHRQAGAMEDGLGNRGAALRLMERAHELDPTDAQARASLARLLLRRSDHRADPAVGLMQFEEAEQDLRRAVQLDPSLAAEACTIKAQLARLGKETQEPGGRRRLQRLGGDPFRATVSCPGPPRRLGTALGPLAAAGKCSLVRPANYLAKIERRYLLVGCAGAQLGVRLERWGCLDQAAKVWRALAQEAPKDPRWPLQIARIYLSKGEPERAEQLLTSHIFLSADRPEAMLNMARLQLQAGNRARAGRRSVMALDLAQTEAQADEAVRLLREAGYPEEAEQAGRRAASRRW